LQKCQNEIITNLQAEGWIIEHKIDIKGCPSCFFKKKWDKLVFILGEMDNKIFFFSQEYLKKSVILEKGKGKEIAKEEIKEDMDLKKPQKSDNIEKKLSENFHVLYVVYKNGTTIFEYQFRDKIIDSDLFTGILSAVGEILKEATGNISNIMEISQENLFILFEHENMFSTILVSDSNEPEIRTILKKFNTRFIEIFQEDLEKWTGEISKFKKTIKMVGEIFNINGEMANINTMKVKKDELDEIKEVDHVEHKKEKKSEENFYYYYCENCKQWYKVDYKGVYTCLYCNNNLINKTDIVMKYKK